MSDSIYDEDVRPLDRFLRAQEHSYDRAFEEIQNGAKRSHWMWYIFPQAKGLGHSDMAWRFGIDDLDEAGDYIDHPVLGERLIEISRELLSHTDKTAAEIFGYPDDLKLRSCMTLFELVSDDPVFGVVLDMFFDGERDEKTLELV